MLYYEEKVNIAENMLSSNSTHLASVLGKLIAYTEMAHSQQLNNLGKPEIIIPKDILMNIIKDIDHISNQSADYYKKCSELYNNPVKSV